MKINHITIVQGIGSDHVMLDTDFPSPHPNFDSHELCVTFQAEYNKGPEYVAANFPGVPVTLVERPKPSYKFSK